MSTEKLELIATAKDEASKVLAGLQTKLKGFGVDLGAITKVGLGAVGAGVALGEAFKGVGEFLGQAAAASINEEKNIARLDAALKANVAGWDGNTAAIETAIKKREDLAFSDDDLRDSLATLVTSTHDVNKALDGQSLAMNIARGRNISLKDASLLVARTLSGNYTRAFKSAGLSLDGISNKTQALEYLTRTYAGQAAAYAETTAGKFEAVSIAVQDANEDLGSHLTPTIGKFAQVAKTDMVPAINNVVDALGGVLDFVFGNKAIQPHLDDLANRAGMIPKLMGDELVASTPDLQSAANQSFASILAAEQNVSDKSQEFGSKLPSDIAGAMRSNKDDVKSAMDDLVYVMTHPLKRAKEIARVEGALSSKQLADGLASNDPAVRAEAQQVQNILKQKWSALTGLSWDAGHAAGNKFALAYISGARNILGPLLRTIAGGGGGGNVAGGHEFSGGGRASGGYVAPGVSYDVGETGQERLRMFPGGGGYVTPAPGGRSTTSSAPHSHAIYLDGRLVGRTLDERMGKELAMSSSYGYIRQ